jgi:hypothetical protein
MVRDAEATAKTAEADATNDPGMCLQQCRLWADIPSRYPDATTAWKNANQRHVGDRNPPRGAAVYWTGGSQGYGHIAIALDDHGDRIRSTDAGGSGRVATQSLAWFDAHWPSLDYAGWADNINEVTIPDVGGDDMKQEDFERIRDIVAEEVKKGWEWQQANDNTRAENLNLAGRAAAKTLDK